MYLNRCREAGDQSRPSERRPAFPGDLPCTLLRPPSRAVESECGLAHGYALPPIARCKCDCATAGPGPAPHGQHSVTLPPPVNKDVASQYVQRRTGRDGMRPVTHNLYLLQTEPSRAGLRDTLVSAPEAMLTAMPHCELRPSTWSDLCAGETDFSPDAGCFTWNRDPATRSLT